MCSYETCIWEMFDNMYAYSISPISLTCVSCQILEHIICRQLLDHLDKNKILTKLIFQGPEIFSRLALRKMVDNYGRP